MTSRQLQQSYCSCMEEPGGYLLTCPALLMTLLPSSGEDPQLVAITLFSPGVTLKAHGGPYAGILRYHLPLTVPENNPPRLRVDMEMHTWQERQGILIYDTIEHEVYHESDGRRVMLIVDIRRPLGRVSDAVNRLSLRAKRKWNSQFIKMSGGDI